MLLRQLKEEEKTLSLETKQHLNHSSPKKKMTPKNEDKGKGRWKMKRMKRTGVSKRVRITIISSHPHLNQTTIQTHNNRISDEKKREEYRKQLETIAKKAEETSRMKTEHEIQEFIEQFGIDVLGSFLAPFPSAISDLTHDFETSLFISNHLTTTTPMEVITNV